MSLPRDTERDPHADTLLASALHAADGVEANDCPDAEVIGLYAERELGGAELRAVEAHVLTCPRCQAIVATFVRTLPDEASTAGADAAGARSGAGESSASGGFAAWFAGWRWLMPAASLTAVVVVAVWVGRGPADEVAESARETLPTVAESDAAAPAEAPAVPREQAALAPPATSDYAVSSRSLALRREAPAPRAAAESAEASSAQAASADTRAKAEASEAEGRQRAVGQIADGAPAPIAPAGEALATASRADLAAPTSGARESAAAAGAPSPAARTLQEAVTVTPASPATEVRAEANAERRARPAQVLGANDATIVRVPPAVSFRLRAETVERSLDQGATWQLAQLPVGVTVVAIASPAPGVCWAIAADAVLRATDGATFTREPAPTTERLTGITATDRMRAVVTAASGARFATTNGGRTWTPAP